MKSFILKARVLMAMLFIQLLISPLYGFASKNSVIETSDITRFWEAYDQLTKVTSTADSVRVMQTIYIDRATSFFKDFIKARNFTATEYVNIISKYPAFWLSIRPRTLEIAKRKNEIEQVLQQLAEQLPNIRQPNVCFAIGCLRTGGTTSKNLILIGSEIAAADASVNISGMNDWLQSVLGKTGDIVTMVAHEAIHTQQRGFPFDEFFKLLKHRKLSLANMAVVEGGADFLTKVILDLNLNQPLHTYGDRHECQLWRAFSAEMEEDPFDYSAWLYNGSQSGDRPADLGYYVGYKVCSAFYTQSTNKEKAIRSLLRRGQYKKIYRKGGYQGSC